MAFVYTTVINKTSEQNWFEDAWPFKWQAYCSFIENSSGYLSKSLTNVSDVEQIQEWVFDDKDSYKNMAKARLSNLAYLEMYKYFVNNKFATASKIKEV